MLIKPKFVTEFSKGTRFDFYDKWLQYGAEAAGFEMHSLFTVRPDQNRKIDPCIFFQFTLLKRGQSAGPL